MRKVLYLSYDGMTEALGESQVLPYLGKMSSEVEFHLISFEKENTFQEGKTRIEDFCTKHSIHWHPQTYTKKPPVLSTLKDLLRMKKIALGLHKKIGFDLIHARSYLPAIIASNLKKRYKIPFLFDMRGFWADERVEGKIWNLKNPLFKMIYQFMKRQEKKLFIESDAIVSLTEKGKTLLDEVANHKGICDKTVVIPCCVDLKRFDPELISAKQKQHIKEELEISEECFVLGYVGSIGTWYMLDEMLLYFKSLLSKNKDAIFLFVTRESSNFLCQRAAPLGIDPSRIRTKAASHDQVPLYLSAFDWSIFFILPSFSKQASSPIKQGELMAMGIPVLTNSGIGDTDSIIQENQAGICLSDLSEESFKAVNLDSFVPNKDQIRQGAHMVFGLEKGANKYLEIYHRIWKK